MMKKCKADITIVLTNSIMTVIYDEEMQSRYYSCFNEQYNYSHI